MAGASGRNLLETERRGRAEIAASCAVADGDLGQRVALDQKRGQALKSQGGKTFLGEYVLTDSEIILGLPQYEISNIERSGGTITISARYTAPISCPKCAGTRLRNNGWCRRVVRHDDWGFRRGVLSLEVRQ